MDELQEDELIEFNKFIKEEKLEGVDYETQRDIFDRLYRHKDEDKRYTGLLGFYTYVWDD